MPKNTQHCELKRDVMRERESKRLRRDIEERERAKIWNKK